MVLLDRIELSTSSLPMKCSTTELQQHAAHTYLKKGPAVKQKKQNCPLASRLRPSHQ